MNIAALQMEPKLLDKESNVARSLELVELTARQGAKLLVFPECALTGYCFSSLVEALPVTEPIPGPSTEMIMAACRKLNVYVIIGLLERDGDRYYNAAALLGPQGLVGKQRKLHLPYLGVDRFLYPGDLHPAMHETEVGRIGIGICYDMMFPEYSRVLALQGADLLVFPANWPETGKVYPDYILPARAIENHVFAVAVNRVGAERGTEFVGGSTLVHWFGRALARGKVSEEDALYTEIQPVEARQKHLVIAPGQHEVDLIHDRKPEFYGQLCQGP